MSFPDSSLSPMQRKRTLNECGMKNGVNKAHEAAEIEKKRLRLLLKYIYIYIYKTHVV